MRKPSLIPDDAPLHARGFENLETETDLRIPNARIRGRIPDTVRGTFFRIGPGRNQLGGEKFGHWFDGDGMMHAMTFTDDGAWYRNRFVRTPNTTKTPPPAKFAAAVSATTLPAAYSPISAAPRPTPPIPA